MLDPGTTVYFKNEKCTVIRQEGSEVLYVKDSEIRKGAIIRASKDYELTMQPVLDVDKHIQFIRERYGKNGLRELKKKIA